MNHLGHSKMLRDSCTLCSCNSDMKGLQQSLLWNCCSSSHLSFYSQRNSLFWELRWQGNDQLPPHFPSIFEPWYCRKARELTNFRQECTIDFPLSKESARCPGYLACMYLVIFNHETILRTTDYSCDECSERTVLFDRKCMPYSTCSLRKSGRLSLRKKKNNFKNSSVVLNGIPDQPVFYMVPKR